MKRSQTTTLQDFFSKSRRSSTCTSTNATTSEVIIKEVQINEDRDKEGPTPSTSSNGSQNQIGLQTGDNQPAAIDIGYVVNGEMSSKDIFETIKSFSDGKRYQLLTSHVKPKSFPKTHQDGCNRGFKADYYEGNESWLAYSSHLDAAFCIPCILFADSSIRSSLQSLVNKPFKRWSRVTNVIKEHRGKKYHIDSMTKAKVFKETIEEPKKNISNIFNQKKLKNIENNRAMLTHIIRAVVYLTKQGLALRSHDERRDSANRGNFLELLQLLSCYSPELAEHLQSQSKVSYTSPRSQNELIGVIGHDCVRAEIIREVNESQFFSILADEATNGSREFLSLVVRYVTKDNTIKEQFLQFHPVGKCTGQILGEQIMERLSELGLDIQKCRGQGYDGAAAMSSDRCGVQAVIRQTVPSAVYVHCASHCLNLVIVHSCQLTSVRSTIDKISKVCNFFNTPLRKRLLCGIIQNVLGKTKGTPLVQLCETRWSQRHIAYSHFYQSYRYIIMSLEAIAFGSHKNSVEVNLWEWNAATRADANNLLSSVTQFDFIACFAITYTLLSGLAGITQKLQSRGLDIFQGYQMIETTKEYYDKLRKSEQKDWYQMAVNLADMAGVNPVLPRICGRMTQRGNIVADGGVEGYYRVNVYLPLVDHLINELESQFTRVSLTATSLLKLVGDGMTEEELKVVAEQYGEDLPMPELLVTELVRWQHHCKESGIKVGDYLTATLDKCDRDIFPNINTLLRIAATLPVTTCECERSFSCLRRLNTYLRATQGSERLDALALINIHCHSTIDINKVIDVFYRLHPRKMALTSLLFEQARSDK